MPGSTQVSPGSGAGRGGAGGPGEEGLRAGAAVGRTASGLVPCRYLHGPRATHLRRPIGPVTGYLVILAL